MKATFVEFIQTHNYTYAHIYTPPPHTHTLTHTHTHMLKHIHVPSVRVFLPNRVIAQIKITLLMLFSITFKVSMLASCTWAHLTLLFKSFGNHPYFFENWRKICQFSTWLPVRCSNWNFIILVLLTYLKIFLRNQ